MDLHLLAEFRHIAEVGSLSRAAAQMNVSQPALTRRLAQLEHALGVRLFMRAHDGMRLTDAGAVLLGKAEPLLRQAALVEEEIAAWRQCAAGHVTIAICSSLRRAVAAPLSARLMRELPGVSVRIFSGLNDDVHERLAAGQADVAVLLQDDARVPPGMQVLDVAVDALCLVEAASAGLRPDRPVDLAALSGRPLLSPGRGNTVRAKLDAALRRRKLAPPEVRLEVESLELLFDLVCGGGATVSPRIALLGREELSWAPVRRLFCTFCVATSRSRLESPATRSVVALVEQEVRRALPGSGKRDADTSRRGGGAG